MKKCYHNFFFIYHFAFTSYCFSQAAWVQKANLPGQVRWASVSFSIGNYGYVGTGVDVSYANYYNDFWQYDPTINIWTQKANFPSTPRGFAIGFSIGSFGYIGIGVDSQTYFDDFWQYDTALNSWIQIANFPGGIRGYATSFVIGNFGYVGTGTQTLPPYKDDFWKYDPITDTWTQITNFPGGIRADIDRASFSIGNKGYTGFGWDNSQTRQNDLWEYDSQTNFWTQKSNLPAQGRIGAVGFSICDKGYVGMGSGQSGYLNDFWEYDPQTNTWSSMLSFPGSLRFDATTFTINNKAYVGTGTPGLSDWWEFSLDCTVDVNEVANKPNAVLYQNAPNPFGDGTTIKYFIPENSSNAQIVFFDEFGNKLKEFNVTEKGMGQLNIAATNLAVGMYSYSLIVNGKVLETKKMVKE